MKHTLLLTLCLLPCLAAEDKPAAPPTTVEQQLAAAKAEIAVLRARIDWDTKNSNMLAGALSACMGQAPVVPPESKETK